MRKTAVALIVLAYTLLLYISLSAPFYARAHPHLDPVLVAEYAAPWPVALGCTLAIAGIALALVPIRRGETWAMLTSLTIFIILLTTRMATDPRCLVVLDPHQHGCHTFMIAMVLGVVGVVLGWFSRRA
jgi:hypothetical protein